MSIRLMSAIFESTTLGPTERLIMLALADHADDDGRCYPSIARLCQRTGLSERAIQTNVKKLADTGYIHIVPGGGKGNSNLYFVSANPASSAPFEAPNPAANAPRRKCTPAADAPQTPQQMRSNPAADAPEPSGTIIGTVNGGGGGAREADPPAGLPDDPPPADPTFRERILDAMGLGPDGIAGPSRFVGGQGDMAEAARWLAMPGMTEEAVVVEVARISAAKADGPASSFRYFTPAMQRLSAALIAPPLQPVAGHPPRASPRPDQPDVAAIMARLEAEGRI